MKGTLRRLVLHLAAATLLAGAAAAQDLSKLAGSTPAQRAAVQTEFMKTRLALGAEQVPKVEAINLKYAQQMQPILQGSEGPLMKLGAARRVDQAKDAELQGVLTPDQFQKYLAAKEEMRQHLEQKLMEKRQGAAPAP
ncbi:MAG TPA: hypothetical protein VFC77_08035 [Myxococcota bacterium]|nr:hypothetical protein [Myxococcota bacterium]